MVGLKITSGFRFGVFVADVCLADTGDGRGVN